MAYIHLYNGTVTAGGTDGTQVSEDGAGTNPISATLDTAQNETKIQPVAIRCETGYTTSGNTVVSFSGTTANMWSVCATADGTYGSTLTISDGIGATNTLFYVRAASQSGETLGTDTSVTIEVSYTINAAS